MTRNGTRGSGRTAAGRSRSRSRRGAAPTWPSGSSIREAGTSTPPNDTAAGICLPDAELPQPPSRQPGSATVTPIGSRLSSTPAEHEPRTVPDPVHSPAQPRSVAVEEERRPGHGRGAGSVAGAHGKEGGRWQIPAFVGPLVGRDHVRDVPAARLEATADSDRPSPVMFPLVMFSRVRCTCGIPAISVVCLRPVSLICGGPQPLRPDPD